MYKIALCDDSKEYLEFLKQKVQNIILQKDMKVVVECYNDSDLLAEKIEENNGYDAYILDVEMPNVSGIELAEKIRKYSQNSYVIFVTAHASYAIEGYGINVLSYVLKSMIDTELVRAMEKLFERFSRQGNGKIYVIQNQRKYVRLLQNDIMYIYKEQKNSVYVLLNGEREVERISLQKVYQKLNSQDMYMLDRGTIINVQHIKKIAIDRVIMDDNHEVFTSKEHANGLKEYVLQYWENLV